MKKLLAPYKGIMDHFELTEERVKSYGKKLFDDSKTRWDSTAPENKINKVITFNKIMKEDIATLQTVAQTLDGSDYSAYEMVDMALCRRYAAKVFIKYVEKSDPSLAKSLILI
ncbi:hypothetical protein E6Q11_05195 [Candidatus Dojkabacteria bacterium]|uniref:Uncharacterized protein n=1 Tax=Candidatus Dojkabacteria bacterium TaxID=2099670 RepID=A0A5C7J4M5_9BACT|nr:MAG: hypothetical protein E6Q11_05195 [Candidatus Dojkabacteria bacterium]